MRDLIIGVLKTGGGVIVNLLFGVIGIKIMAVMLGPSGTGLFSLIRQVISTFSSLGAGGQTALIQGVANKEGMDRVSYMRATFWLFVLGAFFSIVLIQILASTISILVSGKNDGGLAPLIRWLALPIFLLYGYIYLKSILNGVRAIGWLAIIETLGSIATLMLIYPVCIYVREGYALAFVWMLSVAQLLTVSVSFLVLYKNGYLSTLLHTETKIDRTSYRKFWLFVIVTFLSTLLIVLFAPQIAVFLFAKSDVNLVQLVNWVALPLFLLHLFIYLKIAINRTRRVGRLMTLEIFCSLFALMFIYPICIFADEKYALVFIWMMSVAQILIFAASFLILYRNRWLSTLLARIKVMFDPADLRYFFTISSTIFLTGIMGSGALFIVRIIITRVGGLYQAGLFDVAWTLSSVYVMVLLASFGTYYTPTLSQASGNIERAALVRRVIRLSTLLMIPMIVAVVVVKPLLVRTLYSDEYIASLEMVRWMLVGDYLKITSWVFAIPAIVNCDMKIYFWTEAFWNINFVILSSIAVLYFGNLQGIGIAFIILNLILVLYYLMYVLKVYELQLSRDLLLPWLIGFVLVIVVSMQNWNSTAVNLSSVSLWIIASLGLVIASLKKSERIIIWYKLRLKLRMN